jgi:hypothetical protein
MFDAVETRLRGEVAHEQQPRAHLVRLQIGDNVAPAQGPTVPKRALALFGPEFQRLARPGAAELCVVARRPPG